MKASHSIRGFLLLSLALVATGGMLFTALASYLEAAHEVEELFDAQLAQSARVLQATLAVRPLLPDAGEQPLVFPTWHVNDDAGTADAGTFGHKYESKLLFQLWDGEGRHLLLRSANAPGVLVAPLQPGYQLREIAGERFHLFLLQHDGMWLLVAQDDAIREELVEEIALAAFLPCVIGVPLMLVLVLVAVRRGLVPLEQLRLALAGRDAHNLAGRLPQATVTEVQPVVDALNALLARLEESVQRERRFTDDAAHELRTPLAALRLQAENALAAPGDDARRAALGALVGSVDRTARIIEQLLTLARLEPGVAVRERVPLGLNALVREELALLAVVAGRRDQEVALVEGDECRVAGDAATLGILVRNLVDNALRYSPPGSAVTVLLRRDGDSVVLEVADEGPGVAPALAARVFERFFRADPGRGDGAGLGLSIVQRIVAAHEGSVSVRPRAGTVPGAFVVRLPAA